MNNEDIVDTLCTLLATSRRTERAFRACCARSRDHRVQVFCAGVAAQWSAAAADLQSMVAQSGGRVSDRQRQVVQPTDTGPGALSEDARSPTDAFEVCERAANEALERYREALEEPLPALLRLQIEHHSQIAEFNLDELRRQRENLLHDCSA